MMAKKGAPIPDPMTAIRLWQKDPDRSVQSRVASAMMRGEWQSSADLRDAGVNPSNLSQVVIKFRSAGYTIESKQADDHGNAKAYRVRPGSSPSDGPAPSQNGHDAGRRNGPPARRVEGDGPRRGHGSTRRAGSPPVGHGRTRLDGDDYRVRRRVNGLPGDPFDVSRLRRTHLCHDGTLLSREGRRRRYLFAGIARRRLFCQVGPVTRRVIDRLERRLVRWLERPRHLRFLFWRGLWSGWRDWHAARPRGRR